MSIPISSFDFWETPVVMLHVAEASPWVTFSEVDFTIEQTMKSFEFWEVQSLSSHRVGNVRRVFCLRCPWEMYPRHGRKLANVTYVWCLWRPLEIQALPSH